MSDANRAIPTSDYINASQLSDVVVKPWPCQGCDYFDHCKTTGEQCLAWLDYDVVGYSPGRWSADDRVPFSLRDKAKLCAVTNNFLRGKCSIMHNGHKFVVGSLCEQIYLVVGDLGVASNADIAAVLTGRGVRFSKSSLKSTTARMGADGRLQKLPRCLWVWR